MGYFAQVSARLTDEERVEMAAIGNKPDIDGEVIYKLAPRANVSELIHWSIKKRLACHKTGYPEPPFTADDFLAIINEKTEEDKRQKFTQLLTERVREMSTVTINAEDLPGARSLLDELTKKRDLSERLVSLLEEREKLIAQKKESLKGYRIAIDSIDAAISQEVKDIRAGQGRLFDDGAAADGASVQ